MNKEYTPVRRFYAWVGFLALILAGCYLLSQAFTPEPVQSDVSEEKTLYEPILASHATPTPVILATSTSSTTEEVPNEIDFVEKQQITETIKAYVTGYNTVEAQTDSTPCIAADGSNICGRYDAVACPSWLELGSNVMIYGRIYECVDRTHDSLDGRFDINCNKDFECPASVTSYADVHILK